ncbi:MAG: pilus assembly PilX N-terminal domain-containing protein [Candidatus Omnitrophica bacterium]|nr:pilus assembly PilX N-terminal domain-containing protein [Candidatus Omnitrophota bacterium]
MNKKGVALITTMTFLTVLFLGGSSYLYMVTEESRHTERQLDMQKAFFLAESGVERAIWRIVNDNTVTSETFKIKGSGEPDNYLEDQNITVTITDKGSDVYRISSSSQVGSSSKTLTVLVRKNPPAKIFDYAYFINNWGWFYGYGITANGDVRSNGRFDLRNNPRVEGDIYAGFEIDDGDDGIRGSGGDPENQHPDSEILEMPNLYHMSYYETLAETKGGSVVVNGVTLIDAVFGDDVGESGNIVLIGTDTDPIEINGPVVVTGDIVIKGNITGQGCIYAGRNIYLADEVQYDDGPSSPRPSSSNPTDIDNWVIANKDKDLVGFAATESIILGNYTATSGDRWYAENWLFGMGDEDVGQDGIPDTNDTYEEDSIFQQQYEDLDGDGVKDNDYTWSSVQTQAPITNFENCPPGVTTFGEISTNQLSHLDGIFYTNHAYSGRVGYGVGINGSIISKDEAIIYRDTITMNYDERIHSRYSGSQGMLIDVNLPMVNKVEVIRWVEGAVDL